MATSSENEKKSGNPAHFKLQNATGPNVGKRRNWTLRLALGALVIIFIAIPVVVFVGYLRLRHETLSSLQNIIGAVDETNGPLALFRSLGSPDSSSSRSSDLVSRLAPLFTNLGQSYQAIQGLAGNALELTSDVDFLGTRALDMTLHGQGQELLGRLTKVRDELGALYDASGKIAGEELPASLDLVGIRLELAQARDLLSAFLPWLRTDTPRRLLIFLENSSELRPGGGFLGSYIELTLQNGNLTGFAVRDVNDADRELNTKTIPPQPLQLIARNWRAADANWFFDFPHSAQKILAFLSASDLYAKQGIKFDGAVGVTPRVVSDLLNATGPISLPSSTTLNPGNFLVELQKDVEFNQAAGGAEPKKMLVDLVPRLLDKLQTLPAAARNDLLARAKNWVEDRDLRIYFEDHNLQKLGDAYDASGRIFEWPEGQSGDYLAVVNANLGGGKSDAVIQQSVIWQSQITPDGLIRSHVAVTRKHAAKPADAWWYRVPNQNYLQIFVHPESKLTLAQGGTIKKIVPKVSYAREGYALDPDVVALEGTLEKSLSYPQILSFREAGKRVYATWLTLQPGASSTLTLDYEHRARVQPAAGATYEFVFEKQSGSAGKYHIEITAPVGFEFQESKSPVYEYNSADPPGRLVIDLTLRTV